MFIKILAVVLYVILLLGFIFFTKKNDEDKD